MSIQHFTIPVDNPVLLLRRDKLSKGIPFMINVDNLPDKQCYLEYPDGTIRQVRASYKDGEFTIIRQLSAAESQILRKQYNLM